MELPPLTVIDKRATAWRKKKSLLLLCSCVFSRWKPRSHCEIFAKVWEMCGFTLPGKSWQSNGRQTDRMCLKKPGEINRVAFHRCAFSLRVSGFYFLFFAWLLCVRQPSLPLVPGYATQGEQVRPLLNCVPAGQRVTGWYFCREFTAKDESTPRLERQTALLIRATARILSSRCRSALRKTQQSPLFIYSSIHPSICPLSSSLDLPQRLVELGARGRDAGRGLSSPTTRPTADRVKTKN